MARIYSVQEIELANKESEQVSIQINGLQFPISGLKKDGTPIYRKQTVFIPKDINIGDLELKNPPGFEEYHRDKALYIISLLNSLRSYDRRRWERPDSFVRINTKLLEKASVRKANDYFKWLCDVGVLEFGTDYRAGEQSKSFRLTSNYRTQVMPYEIQLNTLNKGIIRVKSTMKKQLYLKTKPYQEIETYLSSKIDGLKYDYQAAMEAIECASGSMSIGSYNTTIESIERLKNGEYFWTIDQTSHRFHSNVTNLKSEFRQFFTYKGRPLVALDIKNSQPYFLTKIIGRHTNTPNTSQPTNNTIMFAESYRLEFDSFCTKVYEGQLYEFIAEEANNMNLVSSAFGREDAKKGVFSFLYSHKERESNLVKNIIRPVFESNFPSITNTLDTYKSVDNRSLAIELQKLESNLILNRVVRQLMNELPFIPIFTLHDSIITTPAYSAYLEKVLVEKASELVGHPPTIKRECWGRHTTYYDDDLRELPIGRRIFRMPVELYELDLNRA